ncbi:MAG: hypothetical protein ACF8GE_08405 [Phycisphaerales bacterium JB043]
MRDDWIFKLAIAVGVIAFAWRLITYPAPSSQSRFTSTPELVLENHFNRARLDKNHIAAAVIATALQQDHYHDHGGWHRISDALMGVDDPITAIERWKSLALNDPDSIVDREGNPVLDDENKQWLRTFFEKTGGEPFVAYYLGVKLLVEDRDELAHSSFQTALDGFSSLVDNTPQHATLWDRLYVARSAMRVRRVESCASALRDLENHIEKTLTRKQRQNTRALIRSIGRTWINNSNMDEGIRVWKQLNNDLLEDNSPFAVIQEWGGYARGTDPNQEPEIRLGVTLVIWDVLDQIEPHDPDASKVEYLDYLEFFVYRARNVGASDLADLAAHRIYDAHPAILSGSPPEDTLNRMARYEALIGNRDAMYDALDLALEQRMIDPNALYSRPAFNPFRDEPRFQQIMDDAVALSEGQRRLRSN